MKRSYLILFILLFLGALLNFFPHLSYPYPLHVDEWTHFTYAQHLSDSTPLYFGGESESLEQGFHILLAVLKSLGVNYLFQFQFLASFLTILISLSLFILVRKFFDEKTALFSVLFFIFIKSSVSFLGPMFLVPLTVGLFMIPIALFMINTNLLFLIIAATLIIHPPSGIALLFLIGSYFMFNRNKKIILNSLLGIILSLPIFFGKLTESGLSNLQFRESIIPTIFIPRTLGTILILIIVIGFYLLVHRKNYVFILYSLILLTLITIYFRFDVNILIFYERNIMYLFEIFSIPFAISLIYFTKKFRNPKLLTLLFLGLLILFIPSKIESTQQVYQIVNETEVDDYLAYRNIEGTRAVIHPWKAIAFAPLAGKEVYSRIPPGPNPFYLERNQEMFLFFNESCSNKTFLEDNEIDIIVGC